MTPAASRRFAKRSRATAPGLFGMACLALLLTSVAATAAEIGAIGKLSPRDGILHLVGTPGARVDRILVKPHDVVSSGDVLILLDNHGLLDAERELARIELEAIQRTTEDKIRLQRAIIQSAQVQLKHSRQSLAEYRSLGANAMAKMELTKRQNAVEEAKSNVTIETVKLKQIQQEQKYERLKAENRLNVKEQEYQGSMVAAPSDGTILKIERQVGERLSGSPVILMANVSEMFVICEVFEGDILKLKPGMKASATSTSLPEPLEGEVYRIERIVSTEKKLAKVLIRLNKADYAERLIGMEVQVTIQL